MTKTVRATFDGEVLRPEETLPLAPNTRVLITVETESAVVQSPRSFLDTARSLNLKGPADWSERRNGVPLLPRRPKGSARPTMELVNRLRDKP